MEIKIVVIGKLKEKIYQRRVQKYLKWISNVINKTEVELISKKHSLSHIVAYLLISRDISNDKEIHTYLNPKLSNLSDPFLLENVELAVRRIWEAKDKNENELDALNNLYVALTRAKTKMVIITSLLKKPKARKNYSQLFWKFYLPILLL